MLFSKLFPHSTMCFLFPSTSDLFIILFYHTGFQKLIHFPLILGIVRVVVVCCFIAHEYFRRECSKLNAFLKQSMMIAVPIQYAVSAAEKAYFDTAFWIELYTFKSFSGAVCHKRDIMFFRHGVLHGYENFIFDIFAWIINYARLTL